MMLKEIKRAARSTVRRLPGEGRALSNAYRQLVVFRRLAATKLAAYGGASSLDSERVYALDPARIAQLTNKDLARGEHAIEQFAFDPRTARGKVYGGHWDRGTKPFDELLLTKAIRERVSAGTDWARTDYYQDIRARADAASGLQSQAQLDEHCERLDRLIASAREGGLLNGGDSASTADERYSLEIGVNIDRDGRYVANDGAYALAIAKALSLPQVPVKVRVRHRQWMEFRNFMWSLSEGGGAATRAKHLYQNPVHADLQDIPAAHNCEDRFEAARGVVSHRGGVLLDIGANLGYFCHRFEDLGYRCFAVEYEPLIARAADKIRIAEDKRFKVITGDLFAVADGELLRGKHWDVVLAFNIFHHFLKRKSLHDKLVAWLKSLDADVMIFEPHRTGEPQMNGAYANYDERAFVDFILSNSVLQRSELVHRCSDGRPVYKLSR
jgi:2-polyprenyl-3-methyl-5-hydroxy-6-metoxy-1,4-benzoquinol methylase